MENESLVVDAFAQLGLDARVPVGSPGAGVDLVLEPEGMATPLELKRRSLVDEEVARRLLAEARPSEPSVLVVADRVTDAARKILTEGGAGYLDLRGRLALRTEDIVINADVPSVKERADRTDALAGKAGLEVATALLMQPERPAAVRVLARDLERAPSTVSAVLAALRRDGLLDSANAVTGTDLFWRVADRWPVPRSPLAQPPSAEDTAMVQALRLGMNDPENTSGWALTDTAAAAAYGAPVAFRAGQRIDFFVPDESVMRRATTLLGTAESVSNARATIRVAPVPSVVRHRVDLDSGPDAWPLAHPLFVALDLAQDVGRGREVLDAWTPEDRWPRVW